MTANLFVIANVKQLRTDGSFRILLPFSRTSWGVGVLNFSNFLRFHNPVDFGTILEGLRNFGGGGGKPPHPNTTPSVRHWVNTRNERSLCRESKRRLSKAKRSEFLCKKMLNLLVML